jgi:hypothetical protein
VTTLQEVYKLIRGDFAKNRAEDSTCKHLALGLNFLILLGLNPIKDVLRQCHIDTLLAGV